MSGNGYGYRDSVQATVTSLVHSLSGKAKAC
jgi:hypothetical protein